MLKVLFITASRDATGRTNVGDRVILAGARNLIAGAFGAYLYQETGRWAPFSQDMEQYDLIVYAGMPQYGSRRGPSEVETRFDNLVKSVRKPVVINIGGGTPCALDRDAEATSTRMAQSGVGDFYRQQTRLALRTTRDFVGKRFFDKIGAACELRPCPSFFSTLHVAPVAKQRDAIAFLSGDSFVTSRVKGALDDHLKRLMDRLPGYELTSHSGGDQGMLGQLGEPHVYFRTELDAINYYATVGKLASLRIHAGVPAWTLGADVVVGAFDGRIHMFADTGMPIEWVDMVTGDFAKLADALADPARHIPFAQRQALIDTAYLSFVERLREACPTIAERASEAVSSEPGFASYPLEGHVERHPGGQAFLPPRRNRPPVFVTEDDPGESGVVAIARGATAAHAHVQRVQLPVEIRGAEFSAELGGTRDGQLMLPLSIKKGALARGPQLRLPFGRYRASLTFAVTTPDQNAKRFKLALVAKTSHSTYGEVSVAINKNLDSVTELMLEFENSYPSANIIFDLILRESLANANLSLGKLTIAAV